MARNRITGRELISHIKTKHMRHLLFSKPIAIHVGTNWNQHVHTEVYKTDDSTIITIEDKETKKAITFRNVGDGNPDAALQFTIEVVKNNRTTHSSFSIPLSLIPLFMEGLKSK